MTDEELPGMLAVAKGVSEQKWPHTMDAVVWAAEWLKHLPSDPDAIVELATDESAMLGWFANAIMAGYDTAMMRDRKE